MSRLLRRANLFSLVLAFYALDVSESTSIGSYVTQYAPLVYLDVNELYLPSDISAQLTNTHPELNFTRITGVPADLDLSDLSSLNAPGSCNVNDFDGCSVYLTSRTNVTADPRPAWLYGVLPNADGETEGAVSTAVVVNDHGNGLVDAFYFYFYAFNLGLNVGGVVLGNHVGDWEHTMVRFMNGQPQTIWYSAHDSGFVYTYESVSKNGSRPIVYASLGGHANYPTPGLQSRNQGTFVLNDTTSKGPLWDPILSAYFYTFTPTSSLNGTFSAAAPPTGAGSSTQGATDWLYFLGKWGDKQYPRGYPDQVVVGDISAAYQDGPTGPLDKSLNRTGTCPEAAEPCNTTSVLPVASGTTMPSQTVSRTIMAPTAATTSGGGGADGTMPAAASGTAKPNGAVSAWRGPGGGGVLLGVVLLCVLNR